MSEAEQMWSIRRRVTATQSVARERRLRRGHGGIPEHARPAEKHPALPEDTPVRSDVDDLTCHTVAELLADGISSIRDIPDDYPLNERQRTACNAVRDGAL